MFSKYDVDRPKSISLINAPSLFDSNKKFSGLRSLFKNKKIHFTYVQYCFYECIKSIIEFI